MKLAMGSDETATTIPAAMLKMTGQLGLIAPGAQADIVAVEGDPLKGHPGGNCRREVRDQRRQSRRAARAPAHGIGGRTKSRHRSCLEC